VKLLTDVPSLRSDAAKAIGRLATENEANQATILDDGGAVAALVVSLSSDYEEPARALWILSEAEDAKQKILAKVGSWEPLVASLKAKGGDTKDAAAQQYAAGLVSRFAAVDERPFSGAIPGLVRILDDPTATDEARDASRTALRVFADTKHPKVKHTLARALGVAKVGLWTCCAPPADMLIIHALDKRYHKDDATKGGDSYDPTPGAV